MATAPDKSSSSGGPKASPPRWLGSSARRGKTRIVESGGWTAGEAEPEKPRWLGSTARRDPSRVIGVGWAEPGTDEAPRWLGSTARRGDRAEVTERVETGGTDGHPHSLFLVDLDGRSQPAAAEEQPDAAPAGFEGSDDDALDQAPMAGGEADLRAFEAEAQQPGIYVVGALGMRLRVAA